MSDLIFHNARVVTPAPGRLASTVVVRDRRIAAVGDDGVASGARAGARRIDLAGRTLVPGFIDAHAHIWKIGHLLTTMLDLRGVDSVEAIVAKVAALRARRPAGSWLLGRGYNEATMAEGRAPTRHDLDRAAPDQPVVLTRTCGHIYAVNSTALTRAGITPDTAPPVGGEIGRDTTGTPTGLLHETAMGLVTRVMPPPSADDYEQMIVAAVRHQRTLGITSSSDCGVAPALLDVYRAADAGGRLPARVNVMPLRRVDGVPAPVPLPEVYHSDYLQVDTVKFLADGGLSGATAALSVPYRHADTRGMLRFDRDDLLALCRESHDAGWRIAIHVIGDVAIDQVLGIYETLGPHPRGLAHRLEHFGLPDARQLARAARLGVVAVPQTIFIHSLGRNFRDYLPDAFLPRCYPIRAMLDAGIPVALSSDAPVVENDNPLMGMQAAVTRRDREGHRIAPEQAITVREALDGYTLGGARTTATPAAVGAIAPGAWADFAVLSADPLTTPAEALPAITVDETWLAGERVHERT
jgi:predicted amidohydrolase YtcJ